jgi:hypothetical protein
MAEILVMSVWNGQQSSDESRVACRPTMTLGVCWVVQDGEC